MIQPNELRIGSYVQDIVSGECMTIDAIGEYASAAIINREQFPLPPGWEMGPIPLTPELLGKCGFAASSSNGIGILLFEGYASIRMMFNALPLILEIDNSRMPLRHIKYLHQLQNLYFSLTGLELEVKL